MTRNEETQYEQDRFGNERKKLDTLRAQEGHQDANDGGLTRITSSDTNTDVLLYSFPSNADRGVITSVYGFNSVGSGDNTFTIKDADLDGSNNITSTARRSVPFNVSSMATERYKYEGLPFQKAIAVESEFEGWVAVSLVVDNEESSESLST